MSATRNVNIVGFTVHSLSNLREIKIFTKPDSYSGFETDADQWTLIQTVTDQPPGGFLENTVLPPFADTISMSQGDRRAFLVTSVDRALLSKPCSPNGVGYAGDLFIRIYSGPITHGEELFTSYGGAYSFNGRVQYKYR